ncbi:hypothetical protein E143388_02731 [Rhodococcus opacus]|nr:hypothetical protein E143388_02731 [Rhodococcus opacus]
MHCFAGYTRQRECGHRLARPFEVRRDGQRVAVLPERCVSACASALGAGAAQPAAQATPALHPSRVPTRVPETSASSCDHHDEADVTRKRANRFVSFLRGGHAVSGEHPPALLRTSHLGGNRRSGVRAIGRDSYGGRILAEELPPTRVSGADTTAGKRTRSAGLYLRTDRAGAGCRSRPIQYSHRWPADPATTACRLGDRICPVTESACAVSRGQDARGRARLCAGIGFRSQSTCPGGMNVGCRSAPISISQSLWCSSRWWNPQSSTRLPMSDGPPADQ